MRDIKIADAKFFPNPQAAINKITYLQAKNELLEAQIEKMKCCGNCQKLKCRFDSKININILYCSDSDMKQIEVGFNMCCCKWEIKENEKKKND